MSLKERVKKYLRHIMNIHKTWQCSFRVLYAEGFQQLAFTPPHNPICTGQLQLLLPSLSGSPINVLHVGSPTPGSISRLPLCCLCSCSIATFAALVKGTHVEEHVRVCSLPPTDAELPTPVAARAQHRELPCAPNVPQGAGPPAP